MYVICNAAISIMKIRAEEGKTANRNTMVDSYPETRAAMYLGRQSLCILRIE
jgi:hypothetical protein